MGKNGRENRKRIKTRSREEKKDVLITGNDSVHRVKGEGNIPHKMDFGG